MGVLLPSYTTLARWACFNPIIPLAGTSSNAKRLVVIVSGKFIAPHV